MAVGIDGDAAASVIRQINFSIFYINSIFIDLYRAVFILVLIFYYQVFSGNQVAVDQVRPYPIYRLFVVHTKPDSKSCRFPVIICQNNIPVDELHLTVGIGACLLDLSSEKNSVFIHNDILVAAGLY